MGSFTELSFHKVLLLLMTVFIGAFVLFYGHFSMVVDMNPGRALSLTTKIATVYAFSALCGALIGSSRRLMQQDEPPWGWFLVAGLLGWLVWAMVTVLLDFRPDLTPGSDEFPQQVDAFTLSLRDALPWSIMPFVCAMGVAALSRSNPLISNFSGINARVSDGIMMGLLLVLGLWITFMVHHGLETGFGKFRLVTDEGLNLGIVLASSALAFVFAFVIGASAIVMARKVANSGLAVEPEKVD